MTALDGDEPVGMTVQSFCSVARPASRACLPGLASTTWPRIRKAAGLCINLLSEHQEELARQFTRSDTDKYAGVGWTPAPVSGSPLLAEAVAWVDCELEREHPGAITRSRSAVCTTWAPATSRRSSHDGTVAHNLKGGVLANRAEETIGRVAEIAHRSARRATHSQ